MTLIKSISGIRGTIGGIAGDNLTPIDAVKFAAAYGVWLKQQRQKENYRVVVGRDARISGEMIQNLVMHLILFKKISLKRVLKIPEEYLLLKKLPILTLLQKIRLALI